MRLLVDGDLYVYRCGFAAERTEYLFSYRDPEFDEDVVLVLTGADQVKDAEQRASAYDWSYSVERQVVLEPEYAALGNVRSMISRVTETLDAGDEDVTIFLSGDTNYRLDIGTIRGYKANRDPDHKPTHGDAIKAYMRRTWSTVTTEGEEADDALGITQTAIRATDPFGSVIVSADKDLDMIPGLHFNFLRGTSYLVSDEDALRFFWTQMLTGDTTDNIPGVPKIGAVKAKAALKDVPLGDMYDVVRTFYVKGYGPEEADAALLENGRLLWIRRQENELWNPSMMESITSQVQ